MKKRRAVLALGLGGIVAGTFGFLLAHRHEATESLEESLPIISIRTSDGEVFSSEDLSARMVIINFWATWCEPCRTEIPLLIGLHALHAPQVAVIGIAIDNPESVRIFEDEIGLDYVSLVGETEGMSLMAQFGNPGHLPFTLVFDQTGKLRHQKTGEISGKDIDLWVRELL